jgi:hypothetical protein
MLLVSLDDLYELIQFGTTGRRYANARNFVRRNAGQRLNAAAGFKWSFSREISPLFHSRPCLT